MAALVGNPCAERSGEDPGVRQITRYSGTGGSLSRQDSYADADGGAPQFSIQRGKVCAHAQGQLQISGVIYRQRLGLREQRGFTPCTGDPLIVNANG